MDWFASMRAERRGRSRPNKAIGGGLVLVFLRFRPREFGHEYEGA